MDTQGWGGMGRVWSKDAKLQLDRGISPDALVHSRVIVIINNMLHISK
jgi:hypothetical protein